MRIEAQKAVMTPEGVYIVATYDENGIPNAMNAAWGIQSDYGEITLFMASHKTTENIEKTGAFTVSFGTVDTLEISDYFGIETGHRVNKIEKAGVHMKKSELVNAPVILEYPLTLECTLKSWNPETGALVGTVVGEIADESVLTEGVVDLGKLRPIIFDPAMNVYRTIGEVAGKAFGAGKAIMDR